MKNYIFFWFKTFFENMISLSQDDADKSKERWANYKDGYGYIDHDELLKEKGVFKDAILVSSRGSIKQTKRARERWIKTYEAKEIFLNAKEVLEKQGDKYVE